MKERPILFSAPMIRALLAGTKTQTRRVVKPVQLRADGMWPAGRDPVPDCPYGQPGDRLWVRECFSGARAYEARGYPLREWGNKVFYWADGQPRSGDWTKPRPSIHMPRTLSRITLQITEVRVERLQDISEADALAEGIVPRTKGELTMFFAGAEACGRTAIGAYNQLWNHLNGPGSWDANPWVWVVGFKRVQP